MGGEQQRNFFGIDGFGDVGVEAGFAGFLTVGRGAESGDGKNLYSGAPGLSPQYFQGGESIDSGHLQIHQNNFGMPATSNTNAFGRRIRGFAFVSAEAKENRQRVR